MNLIGIMQGRLVPPSDGHFQSFPRDHWEQEIRNAATAGLGMIEWIYDLYGLGANPIESDDGIARMRYLSDKHAIAIRSLCADYFMERRLVDADGSVNEKNDDHLIWLVGQCHKLGIRRVVLPFVDASRIEGDAQQDAAVTLLSRTIATAEDFGIEIHLETDLDPDCFAGLLAQLPHPLIKVNYDSGNSAGLGYEPQEEFAAYGARIGSVHIKDRKLHGTTVPLGSGNTDFDAVFSGLAQLRYSGDFILQAARGKDGDEIGWSRQNREFVANRLREAKFEPRT